MRRLSVLQEVSERSCRQANSAVEEKSGLARTFEYKPNIPADQFPKRDDVVPRLVSGVVLFRSRPKPR